MSAEAVQVVLRDSRLRGWATGSTFHTQRGNTAEVAEIVQRRTGDLFDGRDVLEVYVATTTPEGDRSVFPMPLLYFKAIEKNLDQLAGFERELRRTLGTDDLLRWRDQESPAAGEEFGHLQPFQIDHAFRDIAAAERLISDLHASNPDEARRVEELICGVYRAGHAVAVWELKRKFEAAAKRGLKHSDSQRAKALKGPALKKKEAAHNWYRPAVVWINAMLEAAPNDRRRYADIARWIHDNWDSRGFSEGTVEPPELNYLQTKLLPEFAREWGLKKEWRRARLRTIP